LKELMQKAYHKVRSLALRKNIPTRLAALTLGVERVANEMATRGLFP
jgi:glutamate dehydrogenase/leucine dehydrogenase